MRKIQLNNIQSVHRFIATQKQWVHPSHTTLWIVAYQLCGKFEHFFNGKSYMVQDDSVIFINIDDYYEVIAYEFGPCIAAHFTLAEPIDLHFSVYDGRTIPHIKADFMQLLTAWNRRDEYSWCDCSAVFYTIMSKILRCADQSDAYVQLQRYDNIIRARDYIAINHRDPKLSIDDAARFAEVGQRRFGELFRLVYHTTPGHYITRLRITSAQEMLRTSNYTVAEIAASVGFSSPSYFSRVFTREVGVTPSRWLYNEIHHERIN